MFDLTPKIRRLVPLFAIGVMTFALSACGGKQSAASACTLINSAAAKLLPEMHSSIMNASADPSGTQKKFQTLADDFRASMKAVTNPEAKAAAEVVAQDLDKMLVTMGQIATAGKAGKSQDDLHEMVVEQLQPLANTFQNDWNTKLGAVCGG